MFFNSWLFPIFFDTTPKSLAFEIFRLTVFIILIVATIAFFVGVILTREPVPEETLKTTYEEYLEKWASTHDWDKPPESDEGPLKPYLKIMLFFSKQYARIGFTPNKVSVLSFLLACWLFFSVPLLRRRQIRISQQHSHVSCLSTCLRVLMY